VGTAQLRGAAKGYWEKGIMPVVRPRCTVDEDHDFVRDARIIQALEIPAYVQVYNAPERAEEWKSGVVDKKAFASRWLAQARVLVDADAYPGLQVNSLEDLRTVLSQAKKDGIEHLFRHAWFSCHNYGLNRPARYPYDDVNQKALPIQHPEWEFAGSVEQVNRWRQEGKRPGMNVHEDHRCVLGFLAYAKVFEDELGFVPPIICTEGGWKYGDLTDRRYPKVGDFLHQAHHMAMFAWFRDGVLSDGNRLPEYLFAACPWILSGPQDTGAWHGGPQGTRQQTVDAVRSIPRFVRDGSAVQPPAPAPPEPSPAPSPPTPAPSPAPAPAPSPSPAKPGAKWQMSVERQPRRDGIRAIAGSFPRQGIRLDVTDPWGNTVAVTSGSKTEYGSGGFEVPVWADAVYTLRFLGESFQVGVRHEVVILRFSENGSQSEGNGVSDAQNRLVTNWMEPEVVDQLFKGLSRYQGLFRVERE
jgi:hypothetical protein